MQTIELKRGLPSSNLKAALASFLQSKYHRDVSEFGGDLEALEEIRMDALNVTAVAEAIPKLIKYAGQLQHLGSKFPFDEDNIKVTFTWYNFAGKDGSRAISSHDLLFEQAAVLTNVALVNAKLGMEEGKSSPDKLRKACHYYLVAAGVLQHVIEKYSKTLSLPTGADLSETILGALSNLLLAQAQECFVLKGVMDKSIRDAMLAKLAMSASGLYETAAGLLAGDKTVFGPGWIEHSRTKAKYLLAFAYNRKAIEMLSGSKYGAEIVRLGQAQSAIVDAKAHLDSYQKLKNVVLHTDLVTDVTSLYSAITKGLERANRDNDIIYHDILPSRESLGEVGSALVANPIAFKPLEVQSEIVGSPLFDSLPSFAMQQNMLGFFSQRDEIVQELKGLIGECQARVDEAMARMNLPAALDRKDDDNQLTTIPTHLLEMMEEARRMGGVGSIHAAKATLQMLRQDCLDKIQSIHQILEEEQSEDSELRSQYGAQWRRQPSSLLAKPLFDRVKSFEKTLESASQSDTIVSTRIDEQLELLEKLCMSPDELLSTLPGAFDAGSEGLVEAVRGCLGEGDWLRRQLDEEALAVEATSITLNASSLSLEDGEQSEVDFSCFDCHRQRISDLSQQVDDQITRLSSTFTALSSSTFSPTHQSSLLTRSALFHSFSTLASPSFHTLSSNLAEGCQFYSRAADSLAGVEAEAKNFRESRRIEKGDLVQRLQQSSPQYPPHGQQQLQYGQQPLYGQQQPHGQQYGQQPRPGMWTPGSPVEYAPCQQQPNPYQQPTPFQPNPYNTPNPYPVQQQRPPLPPGAYYPGQQRQPPYVQQPPPPPNYRPPY